MGEALHLYCVVRDGEEPDSNLAGLDGRPVSAIRHRDLAVLVSPAPIQSYNSMGRERVLRYLFAHQAVIEKVMERLAAIPVKFGTTARDGAEARKILENGAPRLKAALEAMEGKIELDVAAQWKDLNAVLWQIGEEPEINRQKASVLARLPQEATQERIRIGQMVKARLDEMREERAAEILEALKPLARDLCPHVLPDDRMILNTALLVDRAKEGEVTETLERLNSGFGGCIDFRCVGPLPPYSFATVEIKTFDVETVERARGLLRLKEDAGLEEIREAYRRLVRQCHPDLAFQPIGNASADATGTFEAVTQAYRLLGEYRQVGSSFRACDVGEAVAVELLQRSREPGGA